MNTDTNTLQHSIGLWLSVCVRNACYIQPTAVYHPPSHRLHECSQASENSDMDESLPLTFLMWFLNKWDFSISRFIASIKGSFSSLYFWMEVLHLLSTREHLGAPRGCEWYFLFILLNYTLQCTILSSHLLYLEILETTSRAFPEDFWLIRGKVSRMPLESDLSVLLKFP